jgi:FtsP/CotA-like multicopper oxidase with cupredoxin domain
VPPPSPAEPARLERASPLGVLAMYYVIRGRVLQETDRAPLAGLRVEAWDADFLADDLLGSAITGANGEFVIEFDESRYREWIGDHDPDIYFRVYRCGDLIVSTRGAVLWNVKDPTVEVEILADVAELAAGWVERHIYLKIERIENYSPARPQEKVVPPVQYGRDCLRGEGHENALIPEAEIQARSLTAVVYREYLDSAYLVPKPDKLIQADLNEPVFSRRVPGTVIYARPGQRLRIHVWNCDEEPHSLHMHGLRYGIDSDGSWPFGTEAAHHGGRSDAICTDGTWTYTFEITEDMLGAWPFHDHTHHHHTAIDQGLFGGLVVMPCEERGPRPIKLPKGWPWKLYRTVAEAQGVLPVLERTIKPLEEAQAEAPHELPAEVHARRLRPDARRLLHDLLHFLEEDAMRELALARRRISTEHVPVFFHVMSSKHATPTFDSGDLEEFTGEFEFTFAVAGDHDYFCQHHPIMTGTVHVVPGAPANVTVNIVDGPPMAFSPGDIDVGVGGTVRWENHSMFHHTVTSVEGASRMTHCINGRGFVGNTPTIVAPSGQRIRWHVFSLDTSEAWHNFHPHSMRWEFAGSAVDVRSLSPAESFSAEAQIPPVLLVDEQIAEMQDPETRPKDATLHRLKGDFLFHCHVHHHMMNGMVGLVRAKQSLWLTPDLAHEISHRHGLALDDGTNACPDVDPHPCAPHGAGRWEQVAGNPEVSFMHSVLLPNTDKVLYWGYTRADQSRLWDYSTPAGTYSAPANQPASLPGHDANTSNMWSAEHALLDTPVGHALIHGGFSPDRAFTFDPSTLTWAEVQPTADDRFYATTLVIGDGRAITLFGSASKSIEVYTHGAGWAPPAVVPAAMFHHEYYPWTYLLPDGRLFIAGPHVPTQRFDWTAPAGFESFATNAGDRSSGGEKGSSVMAILRPPDYRPIVYIMGGDLPGTSESVEQIDLSAPAPAWTAVADLNQPRAQQFTATLLPDGRIHIAGGLSGGADGGPSELFDPRNPGAGWILGPTMTFVRGYHSSFLLLRDGSILGGGDPGGPGGPTPHERFFPEYFDLLRPTITNAPGSINYGGTFQVDTPTPADIAEVVILRAGAVTHGYDQSQRGLELVITGAGAGTIDVESPPNPNLAPPGWYLLFVLNASRVPSVGRWIRVTP